MDGIKRVSVKPEAKRYKGGITLRWLLTTILVIFLILASLDVSAVLIIRRYYYNVVSERLQTMGQTTAVAEFFSSWLDASSDSFSVRAREYIDSLPESATNIAEVWVVDANGAPVVTSTGFMPEVTEFPDYAEALDSVSGRAFAECHLSSDEKIMAMTVLLPKTDGISNGGVRYMISLEPIDLQVAKFAFIISLISLFALLLVILSGLFFVRSIVGPVNRLSDAAKSIAAGNYKERVELNNRYDEIAELVNSINYMTEEIDRTDRMRNDFISTVSHELRTPLTAISGWSETLLGMDDKSGDAVETGLKVIHGETQRLYSLVEDLLDFSRMESGRLTLRLEKIDLVAELEDTVMILSENAAREGKKLIYSVPEEPAIANADPDRIRQVFVNIIDNAIKYTGADGIITVGAFVNNKEFTVTVSDNGCGIAPEDLSHVREKFYKANITIKGSGIGLAVCDEILKLHSGSMDIESTLGEGTCVTVKLNLL